VEEVNGVVRTLRAPTARQLDVLRFVHEHTESSGHPPTLREIAGHFEWTSINGVNDHLQALERKGLVVRYDYLTRSVRVTAEGLRMLGVEVCGECGRAK
jgi:SOS-response transcriptional repressor LexA